MGCGHSALLEQEVLMFHFHCTCLDINYELFQGSYGNFKMSTQRCY